MGILHSKTHGKKKLLFLEHIIVVHVWLDEEN